MNNINDPNHPVILFIPEAGIYPYTRGLSVLGDAVTKQGGKVLITRDTGQMLRSPIMVMYNTSIKALKSEKTKIIKITEKYINDVLKRYQFSSIELSDLVDSRLMNETDSSIDKKMVNLKNNEYRGFPVGKIVESDFILETKYPHYPHLSILHKELYIQYIKNTALTIAIADKICERYKPSLFITFNEYAQCQAVRYSAKTHNIRHMTLSYPVHLNIDASRFLLWQFTNRYWMSNHIRKWNKWKELPINEAHIAASWSDSLYRMYGSGSHIFSTRKTKNPSKVFNDLKLDPKRKTIIVYTSSQEERSCSEIAMKIWSEDDYAVDAFSNHIEWLAFLRDYADKNKDIQIVVRIHPREGARQHGFSSQHLLELKKIFKRNSQNFIVVWPNDPISSYDLMELADACLVAWSTIGQEAARLGIPVLSYISNIYYPNDGFIQIATTRKEYKRKLDLILKTRFNWQHLLKAARFYHWRIFIPSLDLGDTVPVDFDDHSVWPEASPSMVKVINNVLSGKQDLIEYNVNKWKKSLKKKAVTQETEAMKKGIRYFLDKIFYPPRSYNMLFRILKYTVRKIIGNNLWIPPFQNHFKDYKLKYSEDFFRLSDYIKETKHNSNLRILLADGLQATLIHNGKLLKRMSPVVIRLAKLHENN